MVYRPLCFSLFTVLSATSLFATNNNDSAYVLLVDQNAIPLANHTVLVATEGGAFGSLAADVNGKVNVADVAFPIHIKSTSDVYDLDTVLSKKNQTVKVHAADTVHTMENVVYTGVGRPTDIDKAISVYQIIDEKAIRAKGAVTLNEALRTELGLNIGQDQMLGSNMSMRGLAGNNVKILVDGLPLNGRENGNVDLSQINLNNIERIEKVQGPMSVMYGSDALGGVINLITKKQKQEFSLGANTYMSSIQQYNFGGNIGFATQNHKVSLYGGRNYFYGWDPEVKVSETRAPLWRPKELYFANFKYQFVPSERANFTYSLDLSKDNLALKSDTLGYSVDPTTRRMDAYIHTTRIVNRLQGKIFIGDNGYFETNNSFSIYDRKRNSYLIDFTTMDEITSPNAADNQHSVFNTINSRTTFNNRFNNLEYTVGYDIVIDWANGVERLSEGTKQIQDYALFGSFQYTLFNKLKIQPGVRASFNSFYKTPVIPSLGIMYDANEQWKVRANYAYGFRAPSIKELYLSFNDANHDIAGNENLLPEKGHHFQLSTAYTYLNKQNHKSLLTVTGMYDNVENQIMLGLLSPNTDPTRLPEYTYLNIAHLRYVTVQLKNQYNYKNFTWDLGASWNKNIATTSPVQPDGSVYTTPDFNFYEVNSNISYLFPKQQLTVSGFYKYTGRQRILGTDITGGAVFGDYMEGFHMVDASIQKDFFKSKLAVIVGGRNLLNIQRLATASGVGGGHGNSASNITTGRSIFLNVRYNL